MPTTTQQFGLSAIGQIFVRARDLERAVCFYKDTLGMPFLFHPPASLVYYLVPDIAAAHTTLRGRGVEFISEPHLVHRATDYELWLADFRDSEGNVLALMTRKPRV